MSAFYLFLLGSQVDGTALLGAAVEEGGFFHTKVSVLLLGLCMRVEVSSRLKPNLVPALDKK